VTNTNEIHVYGGCEYRRSAYGWLWRVEDGSHWNTLRAAGGSAAMLDVLHPLPDPPPPATVTLGGSTWTNRSLRWSDHDGRGAAHTLRLALDRIVELRKFRDDARELSDKIQELSMPGMRGDRLLQSNNLINDLHELIELGEGSDE
jgi:hypothetical protein